MRISFNSGGFKLAGDLDLAGDSLIILSHGFSSNRRQPFISYLSRKLVKEGFSTLRFDYTGRGDSQGRFKQGSITKYKEDLSNAVELAKGYSKKIGLAGHSLGGLVSLLNASNRVVKAVVSLSGVYLPQETLKSYIKGGVIRRMQAVRVGDSFRQDLLSHNARSMIKRLRKPLLIINGDRDEVVTKEQARQLYDDANEPKTLRLIKDCGHNYWKPVHARRVSSLVISWFKKYLLLN